MSLLLDALKKAENEKQKAREAGEVDSSEKKETAIVEENQDENLQEVSNNELELISNENASELEEDEKDVVEETLSTPPLDTVRSAATTTTVSDEALQLLVYKTNKRYRQKNRLAWSSLLSLALIILGIAGAYYYYGMLEEVKTLENKHKIAMRSVRAEPVNRQQPVTVKTVVQEPVVQISASKSEAWPASMRERLSHVIVEPREVRQPISFEKTESNDPVNLLLNNAWQAYNQAEYASAAESYKEVLSSEPGNRDALLGIAAIAVKNAEYKKAEVTYRLLLKLNPRDQVAIAAMANMAELSTVEMSESQLKFALQQQPMATHLNFALGNFYAKRNRWSEAQSAYFKAWQGDNENGDYLYNLAVSLDHLGETKEALRFYKKSLLIDNKQNTNFSSAIVEKRITVLSTK